MDYLVICTVALLASGLTFFSGFGLGTLLLPAFALFFPIQQAVALTAVVHLLNGLFKLALLWRRARWDVVWRFGLPALLAALLGAWLLLHLARLPPVLAYHALGHDLQVAPVALVVGVLLLVFAGFEVVPRLRAVSFGPHWLPLGGALSGFFGGLSGMQGALRSAFLVRTGLDKQAFVATGAVIASLIDVARLGVYGNQVAQAAGGFDPALLLAAVLAAFAGAALGNRFLHKVTMPAIQRLVAALLLLVALGLVTGLL